MNVDANLIILGSLCFGAAVLMAWLVGRVVMSNAQSIEKLQRLNHTMLVRLHRDYMHEVKVARLVAMSKSPREYADAATQLAHAQEDTRERDLRMMPPIMARQEMDIPG